MTNSKIIKIGSKIIEAEINGLRSLIANLDSSFERIIDEILKLKGRVILSGMGKSGHIARKIASTLASTGTPAFFIHPGEASHGDLGMIQTNDLVILLSNSGETAELKDIINYCKRFHVFLAAIVRNPTSTLGMAAELCLTIPNADEALEFDAPTTSTTMMLALGDAIALTLLDLKGFSREDFQIFHPGGRLGASFYRVKDIMHVDYELPIVQETDSVELAIHMMSQKRFGCTAVIDKDQKLSGIYTDGELRRTIALENLLSRKISEVMVKNPITINANSLVVEAIDMMNKKRILCLLVTDENNYLKGLLHMHDCLKVGASPAIK